MCDPITSTVGVTAIGAGISSIDKTRRDANKAARAQEDAARAALEQQQKQTDAISAAMQRPTVTTEEPLKAASDRVDQARASTERQQLLRRGVMSTFTRYPTASTAAPNLAGKASTLGGR
jgi:hypothetical protein